MGSAGSGSSGEPPRWEAMGRRRSTGSCARPRLGRGVRAVAQNAETAALMGVNIDRVVSLTFLLGGLMAGAAGLLYVVYLENTGYNIGFPLGIKAFTAAVMGGIGNLRGALIGGLALGLIENYGAAIWGAEWEDVISFTVLLIVLTFRPTAPRARDCCCWTSRRPASTRWRSRRWQG